MKKTLLALLLLTPCAAFAAAPPTFVLPTSAKGTNIQLTTPSITGGTNTGQLITGATITGSITGTNAVLTSPAITGGTNTGSIITGATITGSITGTNAVLTTPSITGGTNTGQLITGATITGSLTGTNAVLTTPAITGGTNTSSLFLNSTLTGFTSSLQTNTDLTASRVLVSDSAQRITNSSVSTTTLGYLDATSSIQTQLNAKGAATNGTFSGGTFTGGTNVNLVVTGQMAAGLGSLSAPTYSLTGDADTGMWSSGANTLNFSIGGVEVFRMGSGGAYMTNSGTFLSIAPASSTGYLLFNPPTNQGVGVLFQQNSLSQWLVGNSATVANDFGIARYSDAGSYVGAAMTILRANGYVGLGNVTPDYQLTIGSTNSSGTLHIVGGNFPGIVLDNTTGTGLGGLLRFQKAGVNKFGIGTDVNGNGGQDFWMHDYVAEQTRLFVNSSGNVGIGTTSPQYLLDLNGQARIIGTNGMRFGGLPNATDDTVRISQPSANVLALTATSTTVSGTLTPTGRLILPMGEISYFNTTGTLITIGGTSDGSSNMQVVNPATALSSGVHEFDNGGGNTGRLRFTGSATRMHHVAVTVSGTPSTPSDVFVLGLAKNGTVVAASKVLGSTSGTQLSALHAMVELASNDYIELYIGNVSGTRNFTVKSLNIFSLGN